MDVRLDNGLDIHVKQEHKQQAARLHEQIIEKKNQLRKEDLEKIEKIEKKEYNYEDAIMDLESIKQFLYMLAGIPYTPKDKTHDVIGSDGSRWA